MFHVEKQYWQALILSSLVAYASMAQSLDPTNQILLKGSVVESKSYTPIAGVEVSTNSGAYTKTNQLGEFSLKTRIGDEITFRSPDFKTVRHRITSDEDIRVVVEDYEGPVQKGRQTTLDATHRQLLDSAKTFKNNSIEKSIDYVARSIAVLGKNPNKRLLAQSLTALGEIYLYHKQFDLAIDNFEDALNANKTIYTQLYLAEAYLLNKEFDKSEQTLKELEEIKQMVPYQRIRLRELYGDVQRAQGDPNLALEYYEEGLRIAQKNQVTPKVTDLTSKIGETYASQNRAIEAQGYFDNSLKLSKKENPKRAIEESEKVADFYNSASRFSEEIQQRKSSLNEIRKLEDKLVVKEEGVATADSITPQRINYKIANAYVAQNKLDEAIPYLQRSIVEADSEDDLVVQKDATRKLSEVYEDKGDFTRAYETYQDYVALVDTLYVRKEQEISRAVRQNREIAAKQNRISSLEQERELSQSKYDLALTEQQLFEESNKRQKLIIYSLLIGLLLAALTAFFYYRSNRQQKLANNLLALKSLRTQMNPHFIFNALNSVNNYIAKNDERSANRFLSEFSVLMRTVLENSEQDFIPLEKELELLKLYVKLEHSRFSDKFEYAIRVDENINLDQFEIPPMLLQPYIENAIWHGLRYKETKGFLEINVKQLDDKTLKIEILDDGIGRKKSAELKTKNQKKQNSKGMGNIKKRIAILNDMYKNKVEVNITDLKEDKTGTKVTLMLKKD